MFIKLANHTCKRHAYMRYYFGGMQDEMIRPAQSKIVT